MMFSQLVCILLALIGSSTLAFEKDYVETSLKRGLEDYLETGHKSQELEQALIEVQLPQLFRRGDDKGLLQEAACTACNVGINVLLYARRRGASAETIINLIEKLCVWLKIESEPICHGTITLNAGTLVYIIDNKPDLTAKRICSILLQTTGCEDPDRQDWSIEIPPRNSIQNFQKPSKGETLKVLQLSDAHYDPKYQPGSNGACDAPLCCQEGSTPAKPEDAAGYWGDYRSCDTPWHAFIDSLDHIVAQHKQLDYVYFTGDIINHKVWDTDIPRNTKAISDVLQKFKAYFGETPVFPILGNHEPHPVNLFSSEGVNDMQVSTQWVFDLSAEEWMKWLPKDTRETILRGGYYTVLVKPGFRIIALNSNVCYTFNWWLFYDDVDPFGQLQWLTDTLLQAETNNEKVHILSHVPTTDISCLHNWSKQYARIINRFADTIIAQFNGHTHFDETIIFFSADDPSKAINVAFNGGSLTAFTNLNPNYKVYDIDAESLEVQDFESWTYNITEANINSEIVPNWYKLYSFKNAYQVESLEPQALSELTERMAKGPELTERYFRYKHREADRVLSRGCDDNCQIGNLCYMVTYVHGYNFHCEILTDIYLSHRPKTVNGTT